MCLLLPLKFISSTNSSSIKKRHYTRLKEWLPMPATSLPPSNFQRRMPLVASGTTSAASVKQRSGLALQPSIFPIPSATPCRMNTRRISVTCANAFSHEAGIHQDGMLKNRMTYEIMTPQSVGWTDTKLVLGKHSGRHGLDARLRQLGLKLNAEDLKEAYRRFVSMADRKKYITDADLLYIVESGEETPAAI